MANYVNQLKDNVYSTLDVLPWFQSHNTDVAYIQLIVNQNLASIMVPFTQHPCYSHLYTNALNSIDQLGPLTASTVVKSFIYLGLPIEDALVHSTIRICEDSCATADIHDLAAISDLARILGRNSMPLSLQLTRRLADIVDDTPICCDYLKPLITSYYGAQLYASEQLNQAVQMKFIGIIERHTCLLTDLDTLGLVLRGIRKFPLNKDEDHYKFRIKAADMVLDVLRNGVDFRELTHANIGELCNHLQNTRLYHRDLAERFQVRALELIQDADRICAISNSMYAFNTRSVSRESRRIIENKLFHHMPDADLLILSNLADTLRNMRCLNSDVLSMFHQLILDNADALFVFITRLEKVVRHLSWQNFRDRRQEDRFMEILLEKLNTTQLGLATWCLTTVACYLLRNTRYTIPSVLYDKLIGIIPQCKIRDLYPILVAMNTMSHSVTPSAVNQLYCLQTMIYANVADRMDTIDNIDLLAQILLDLLNKSPNPDLNITERLMALFPKFTQRIHKHQFHKVVSLHSQLKYYNPAVFDDLATFVIAKHREMNVWDMLRFLTLLISVGYVPKCVDQLKGILLAFYDAHASVMEIDESLTYVHFLGSLQIFPDDILTDLFNIEFIQRVDHFLEGEENTSLVGVENCASCDNKE